jgi:hypothetical protein
LRVLGRSEDLGRKLVLSLSPDQQKSAIISPDAPKDILNDPARATMTPAEGLAANALNPAQRATLEQIVREYLGNHRPEIETSEWDRIQASGWDSISFAWAGSTEVGKPHYYRIQGKTFVVEYDNTQNEARHPHAVWRDRERDFGVDLLKEHYSKNHTK